MAGVLWEDQELSLYQTLGGPILIEKAFKRVPHVITSCPLLCFRFTHSFLNALIHVLKTNDAHTVSNYFHLESSVNICPRLNVVLEVLLTNFEIWNQNYSINLLGLQELLRYLLHILDKLWLVFCYDLPGAP